MAPPGEGGAVGLDDREPAGQPPAFEPEALDGEQEADQTHIDCQAMIRRR